MKGRENQSGNPQSWTMENRKRAKCEITIAEKEEKGILGTL